MSAAVAEISRQVTTSSSVADQARGHAEDSRNRIAELADRADKINNVLSMIGDIAEQTNLLALNATIEAARAGDAGKGFAVVASEVKSLANQSANATDEIGKLLSGILEATGDAVQVNKEIVSVVSQISDSSAGIASAVEEQTATTDEIARAAQLAATDTVEAGRSVADLNEIGNKITEASRLTAKVVSTLSEKTLALSQRSNDFIAGIRAG
jgi:methyl-accepting chemotaxis protein